MSVFITCSFFSNTGPKVAFPLAGHKQDMYMTFHVHFTFPPSMTYHISCHMSYGG